MRKKFFKFMAILLAIVIFSIASFQIIKCVTRPAIINEAGALSLSLKEGQKAYTLHLNKSFEWDAYEIPINTEDETYEYYSNPKIINDFFIRYFQEDTNVYAVVVHFTGEEEGSLFGNVVVDEWYIYEKVKK